jgi:hypothetical protein
MPSGTKADEVMSAALSNLGLLASDPKIQYDRLLDIVQELEKINAKERLKPSTTGAISERLCELALKHVLSEHPRISYKRLSTNWKWLGDFVVKANPYDVTISVKSFKARERLLASGTGSVLAPTIGWGLFNSAKEWSEARVRSHLYRGFVAIYMPPALVQQLSVEAKNVANINGKPLVRDIQEFPADLLSALPSPSTEHLDMRLL